MHWPFCWFGCVAHFPQKTFYALEARWPSGRASDSGAIGRGLGRRVVSLSKIHLPPKSTCNTQEVVAPSQHD